MKVVPWRILLALLIAVCVGLLVRDHLEGWQLNLYRVLDLGAQVYLSALRMLVIPLVGIAILHSFIEARGGLGLGRLAARTFFYYAFTALGAGCLGLVIVNTLLPMLTATMATPITGERLAGAITSKALVLSGDPWQAVADILTNLVPTNIVNAAAQGNMLGIIFFSMLLGYALLRLPKTATTSFSLIDDLFLAVLQMTRLISMAMPVGVIFLVGRSVATGGLGQIGSLLIFAGIVLLALALFACVILPIILLARGIHPLRLVKIMWPALIAAFSTSSGAAALPVTIHCLTAGGIPNRVVSFVAPLGTTFNMTGSGLYECVAALFIAQLYGLHLPLYHQILVVALSLLTSMGMAGVASSSLIAIVVDINLMGLPMEAATFLLPVERLLEMARTTTNVFSDACCCALVAREEAGEPPALLPSEQA